MTKKVKSKKKKIFLIVVIAAVLIIGAIFILPGGGSVMEEAPSIAVMLLERRPLVDSISASGGVRSMETTNVFSSQTGIIAQLLGSVGDSVSAGDTLAVLDDTALRNQILQAENSLISSADSADLNVLNARAAFETARSALERQTLAYNTQRNDLESGTSGQILTMENAANTARIARENAVSELSRMESDHESNMMLFDAGAISRLALDTSADALRIAQNAVNTTSAAYNAARVELDAARGAQSSQVEAARLDLEAARLNYNNAAMTLSQLTGGTATAITTLDNQILALEMLNQQLDDSVITSPTSGVITDRLAVVGGAATGILFIIEDTTDLYVTMRVREHNLSRVYIGQPATVQVDAASNRVFDGEVIYISPRAVTAPGDTSVEFEVRVRMFDVDDSVVRIGMNASANLIVEQRDDAFAVFYDAIIMIPGEGSFIYILNNNVVERVAVTTGMRTDMFIEITGAALEEGMVVISNPFLVELGQVIEADRLISPRTFIPPNSGDQSGAMMIQGGGPVQGGGGNVVIISN